MKNPNGSKAAPLTAAEYQERAMATAGRHDTRKQALTCWALGLAGEAGEVADLVKKHAFHGHMLDRLGLFHELGDVAWYLAAVCEEMGWNLSDVLQANLDKLSARYPAGFSQERSQNRDEPH